MDKDLLYRFFEGHASVEEMKSIKEWAETSEENSKLLRRERKLFNAIILSGRLKRMERQTAKKKNYFIREFLKVASVVVITVGVTAALFSVGKDKDDVNVAMQTITVPAGQRVNLDLPDGSNVWLNAGTRMQYPVSFMKDKREVILDGEAYFDVKHNGDNPFVVRTKSMNVTVLGTEFNVSAYSGIEEFNIALLRGSVELNSSDRSGKYRMKAGEQIFYREGKYVSAQIGNMDYFKWKEGVLSFNNQPIHVIIDKLRLYYDIRIEVADLPFLEERYSGKFRVKEGVEQVLKVLQLEHKFTYVKDNELNLITIK